MVFCFLNLCFATSGASATPSLNLLWSYTQLPTYGRSFGVGDLNCDKIDDFFVNNTNYSSNKGLIDVYYGGQLFDGNYDVRYVGGPNNNAWFNYMGNGFDVGDYDNDGCDDLLVGSIFADEGGADTGTLYVFKGSAGLSGLQLLSSAVYVGYGNATDKKYLGAATRFGDFNGDGYLDIATVAIRSTMTTTSSVIFYLNNNKVFNLSTPDKIITTSNTYLIGDNGSYVMDYDQDGYDDYILPDATYDATARKLYIYEGGLSLPTTYSTLINQEANGNYLGYFRSAISSTDINMDGYEDLCMGAYSNDSFLTNAGRVYCWFGELNPPADIYAASADITITGTEANLDLGRSINFSDINNDGIDDLVVGAYQSDLSAGSRHGRLYVYRGNGLTISQAPWMSIIKTSGDEIFGNTVLGYDFNGNGWEEVIVWASTPSTVYVYEISHGTSGVTPDNSQYFTTKSITGNALESNASFTIGGVQWSSTNTDNGTWNDCSADDSSYDSMDEDFACDLSILSDGSHTMYFRSHDQDELYVPEQEYVSASFTIDTGLPTGSVLINDGDSFTDNTNVSLTLSGDDGSGTGLSEMIICNESDFSGCSWEAYNTSKSWTLDTGDGVQRVYIKFKDTAGNESISYTDTIILDTEGPVAGSVTIDSGNSYTGTTSVLLTIYATDNTTTVDEMMISEDPSFSGASWEAYDISKAFILSSGDGLKTVYVKYRDTVCNESDSYQNQITLDTTAPAKVVLTNIGKISKLYDQDWLQYYFTSQIPYIQGRGEVNATVYFTANGDTYTTIVGLDGRFGLSIDNPPLFKGRNGMTYYQKDGAGNTSPIRTLVLIVGEEYFPVEEPTVTVTPSTTISITPSLTGTVTPTNTPIPTLIPTIVPTQVGGTTPLTLIGVDGTPLVNATVTVDGLTYTTDDSGIAWARSISQGTHEIKATVDGVSYSQSFVLGANELKGGITLYLVQDTTPWWVYVLGTLVLVGSVWGVKKWWKRRGAN